MAGWGNEYQGGSGLRNTLDSVAGMLENIQRERAQQAQIQLERERLKLAQNQDTRESDAATRAQELFGYQRDDAMIRLDREKQQLQAEHDWFMQTGQTVQAEELRRRMEALYLQAQAQRQAKVAEKARIQAAKLEIRSRVGEASALVPNSTGMSDEDTVSEAAKLQGELKAIQQLFGLRQMRREDASAAAVQAKANELGVPFVTDQRALLDVVTQKKTEQESSKLEELYKTLQDLRGRFNYNDAGTASAYTGSYNPIAPGAAQPQRFSGSNAEDYQVLPSSFWSQADKDYQAITGLTKNPKVMTDPANSRDLGMGMRLLENELRRKPSAQELARLDALYNRLQQSRAQGVAASESERLADLDYELKTGLPGWMRFGKSDAEINRASKSRIPRGVPTFGAGMP